jgi:hypothetical protein
VLIGDAKALYRGSIPLQAAYAGSRRVWPPDTRFATVNWVTNPNLESAVTTGWRSPTTVLTITGGAWGGKVGAYSLSNRQATVGGYLELTPAGTLSTRIPTTGGDVWRYGISVCNQHTTTMSYRLLFKWWAGGSTAGQIVEPVTAWVDLAPQGWARLECVATCPVSAGIDRFEPIVQAGNYPDHTTAEAVAHSFNIWVDAAILVKDTSELPPFFDGSTPADADYTYAWTGTPNASTSTRTPR